MNTIHTFSGKPPLQWKRLLKCNKMLDFDSKWCRKAVFNPYMHLWLDGHLQLLLLLTRTTTLAELSIQKPFSCLGLFGIHTKGNCSHKLLDSLGVLTTWAECTETCSHSHLHLKIVGRGELHSNLEVMVFVQVGELACGPSRMVEPESTALASQERA